MALRITEIFYSLQGEASRVGLPTVFVRLTGCPLRCTWCDTTYSFTGGEAATIDSVLAEVRRHPARQVCVTGGEPLSQKDCLPLLTALCDAGYDVSLETSGALDISGVDPRVSRIMDLKAPGSGEVDKNRWENLACLTRRDELKIVLASRRTTNGRASRCVATICRPVARSSSRRPRARWRPPNWPNGFSKTVSMCVSRCSCTSSFGVT